MPKTSTRLVVKPDRPWRRWFWLPLIVVVAAVSYWGLYRYARMSAEHDFFTLQAQNFAMRQRLQQLEGESDTLRERNIVLERQRRIEGQAFEEMQRSMRGLQEEMLGLKEEVAFYRSIVVPSDSARGLRIQAFQLRAEGRSRVYRYTLVLTQVAKSQRVAEGSVTMTVEGLHHGDRRILTLADVSVEKADALAFSFKYFQSLEGDIILPEGFSAQRIKVKVSTKGEDVEQTFDWPDAESNQKISRSDSRRSA